MRTKCCICGEKDAKIKLDKHWKTGLVMEFVEGTCGDAACLEEFDRGLEIGYELAKKEIEQELLEDEVDYE